MHSIPQIFEDFLQRRDREWLIKADIDGVEYTNSEIVDIEVSNSIAPGQEFELGGAILSKLILRMRTIDTIPPNAKIVPYLALSLAGMTWEEADYAWEDADWSWDGGTTEWLPLGEFYVDSREQVNRVWEYTCYDKLVWADVPYISALSYPTAMQAVFDEICDDLEYTYDDTVVIDPTYQIMAGPAGFSKRQILAYIASANSASIYIGKDGTLKFRRFAADDEPVYTLGMSDYFAAKQTNPVKTYTRVVVTYDTEDGLTYEAGSGDENHTLHIENPFVTQEIVDDLLSSMDGFSYMPLTMDARGYPQLEVGDPVTFQRLESLTWDEADMSWDEADFPWDGMKSYQTVLLHTTFGFRGGLKMAIDAPSKSEQQSEFVVEGTLTQQVNRLNERALKFGKPYYGITHSREHGIVIQREDQKSKLTLNSDVMDWQVDGVSSLYYDALANRLKFTGTLEGVDGEFSGTIQAGTIIGGTISGTAVSAATITGGSITGATITGGSIFGTTVTGSTVKTASDGFDRVELRSAFADIAMFTGSSNIFAILNNGTFVTQSFVNGGQIIANSGILYFNGNIDFSGATVTGL